ncbi:hypothetical protein [Methyloceanibacter marginalis]|uniref:hypothetical protein n=1 Tax=Methyloceanibacter marginalis TaxID=1774971 RepID=UPI001FCDF2AD|nr:hypothetical protein [Methyloceanibacter marginalis]
MATGDDDQARQKVAAQPRQEVGGCRLQRAEQAEIFRQVVLGLGGVVLLLVVFGGHAISETAGGQGTLRQGRVATALLITPSL